MMGRQSRQMAMIFVDIESLIPETHLLRKIERMVSFNFIYDLLAPYYPATGRPSVDPVSMFKMLLIGYLYGIKSERRLVEEVQLNIAYRWFCGFEQDDTIPNHSTFSKTRTQKWQQSYLFQKAFYETVKQCIDSGLIDGEAMAADGSYIPANVSRESWINVEIEVEQSMQSYLDSLDEELSNQPGFKKPPTKIVRKCRTTSQTDPDSGYINHGSKRGIGYLMEVTVDCKHGILTGVLDALQLRVMLIWLRFNPASRMISRYLVIMVTSFVMNLRCKAYEFIIKKTVPSDRNLGIRFPESRYRLKRNSGTVAPERRFRIARNTQCQKE